MGRVENGPDRGIPEQSLGKYKLLPTKKSGPSRLIFRRKSFGSR